MAAYDALYKNNIKILAPAYQDDIEFYRKHISNKRLIEFMPNSEESFPPGFLSVCSNFALNLLHEELSRDPSKIKDWGKLVNPRTILEFKQPIIVSQQIDGIEKQTIQVANCIALNNEQNDSKEFSAVIELMQKRLCFVKIVSKPINAKVQFKRADVDEDYTDHSHTETALWMKPGEYYFKLTLNKKN